jgi:hypothetical protein
MPKTLKISADKSKALPALKSIIWDYDVAPGELYEVITGQRAKAGPFTFERLFVRMLERLSWYELIDLLGMEYLKQRLSQQIIDKVRFKTLRGRYENVRKVLSGEPLSFSGWNPEYREEIKHTLLSNRWYRAQ